MRVEFGSMAQADFYLRLCEEILKSRVIAPGGMRLPQLYSTAKAARGCGYMNYADLIACTNIAELAKGWVHHSDEILGQAFTDGFRLAIDAAEESGFACHSLPAFSHLWLSTECVRPKR